jgi:tetratricopeptide (TPR) repeat protein
MLLYVHRTLDWDWAAAEADGQRALAIDPTNPTVLGYMALISRTLGRWGDAEGQLRAALARDPLNPLVISDLAGTYYRAGRYAESEALNRKLLELQPDFAWARYGLARTLLAQGKPDSALAVLQQEGNKGNRLQILPIILQAAGRQVEADEALEEQIAHWADTGAFYVARTYAFRGDHERSLQWLERAYKQKDPGLADLVGEHAFSNIADDPRFKAFLRKMNLPEWPRV